MMWWIKLTSSDKYTWDKPFVDGSIPNCESEILFVSVHVCTINKSLVPLDCHNFLNTFVMSSRLVGKNMYYYVSTIMTRNLKVIKDFSNPFVGNDRSDVSRPTQLTKPQASSSYFEVQ